MVDLQVLPVLLVLCVCLLLLSHQYFFNVGGCIHIIIRLERLIILVSVDIRHHVY